MMSTWGLPMRLPSILLVLLAATLVTAAPARAQQGLTNADIIKMQSAGLSENIILASVNGQPAAYDTSTDGLLALKKAGVTDAVVASQLSLPSNRLNSSLEPICKARWMAVEFLIFPPPPACWLSSFSPYSKTRHSGLG